jgi:tetratricopeptide (TPR) repeat protein
VRLAFALAGAIVCLPAIHASSALANEAKPAQDPSGSSKSSNSVNSAGAASDAEAALLLAEGRKAFAAKKHERAASRFQRLVDRYPGYPGYLEAHLRLGQSLLALGRADRAITPLKYYVQGTRDPEAVTEGRIWLARAYLKDGRFNEAYLTTKEIEASKPTAPSLRLLAQENQLIKSRALQGLGRAPESKEALETARKLSASGPKSAALKAEASSVEIELKLGDCARLPSPGKLAEDQARNQYERRGTCLLESLPLYKVALNQNQKALSDETTGALEKAFAEYHKACGSPPEPTETEPTPRSPEQLRQYRRELKERLLEECGQKLKAASGLLSEWSGEHPKRLRSRIESLGKAP